MKSFVSDQTGDTSNTQQQQTTNDKQHKNNDSMKIYI